MNRRSFLKLISVAAVAVAAGIEIALPEPTKPAYKPFLYDPLKYRGDFVWRNIPPGSAPIGFYSKTWEWDATALTWHAL